MARKLTAPQVRALRSGADRADGIISPSFEARTVEVLVGREFADWGKISPAGMTVGVITDAGRAHLAALRPGTGTLAHHADNPDVAAAVAVLTAAGLSPALLVGDDIADPQNRQADGFLIDPRCETEVRVYSMSNGSWRHGDRTFTGYYADALTAAGWDVRQGMFCLFAVRPQGPRPAPQAAPGAVEDAVTALESHGGPTAPQGAPQAVEGAPTAPAAFLAHQAAAEARAAAPIEAVECACSPNSPGGCLHCGGDNSWCPRHYPAPPAAPAAPITRKATTDTADERAAALLTADDVAEAVRKALVWHGYGAARRRMEAKTAPEILAADFQRARRVMRRTMANGGAPVALQALNDYNAARIVLLAARRIEAEAAAQGPQDAAGGVEAPAPGACADHGWVNCPCASQGRNPYRVTR